MPPSTTAGQSFMAFYATDVTDLAQWRQIYGVSRVALAQALSVSVSSLQRWEAGRTSPARALRVRLMEVMRCDAADHLAVTKLVIRQSRALSALFDVSDLRLLCVSQGLRHVWPNFCAMTEISLLPFLTGDAQRLMSDRIFLRKVRQGRLLALSGVADRHMTLETDPPFRHRWCATFRAYGPQILAQLTYEPCPSTEEPGIRSVIRFGVRSVAPTTRQVPQKATLSGAPDSLSERRQTGRPMLSGRKTN